MTRARPLDDLFFRTGCANCALPKLSYFQVLPSIKLWHKNAWQILLSFSVSPCNFPAQNESNNPEYFVRLSLPSGWRVTPPFHGNCGQQCTKIPAKICILFLGRISPWNIPSMQQLSHVMHTANWPISAPIQLTFGWIVAMQNLKGLTLLSFWSFSMCKTTQKLKIEKLHDFSNKQTNSQTIFYSALLLIWVINFRRIFGKGQKCTTKTEVWMTHGCKMAWRKAQIFEERVVLASENSEILSSQCVISLMPKEQFVKLLPSSFVCAFS